jgi:hypothetical protein
LGNVARISRLDARQHPENFTHPEAGGMSSVMLKLDADREWAPIIDVRRI